MDLDTTILLILLAVLEAVIIIVLGLNCYKLQKTCSEEQANDLNILNRKEEEEKEKEKNKNTKSESNIMNLQAQLRDRDDEINKYKQQIYELTRDRDELTKLLGNEPSLSVEPIVKDEPQAAIPKEVIKYASCPRSANGSTYFSDLTESISEDSYFEVKISQDSNTAMFKPLDFMKIRNFDSTRDAICTEGVQSNIASTVLDIKPGKAHFEADVWIIDNRAIIKLA